MALLGVVPVMYLYYSIFQYFRRTSREIKRLEANYRSGVGVCVRGCGCGCGCVDVCVVVCVRAWVLACVRVCVCMCVCVCIY
jgi:hypothetical protein